MLYILGLVSIVLLVQSTQGRFIQATCRQGTRYCVQQNTQGTWCFSTEAVQVVTTDCSGSQLELQGAVDAHLKQDLSIAYYNGVDNSRLGGVDYAVNTTTAIVRLCLSNSAGDGLLQTLCMNIAVDNSLDGSPYCLVTLGPPVTTDGCYVNVAVTSRTTSSSTTITTSSSTTTTTSFSTSFQPTFITDPVPISTRSSSASTQSTTLSASGASNNSAKPKSNKITTVIVPVVLTILVLIAIGIGIIFWRRQKILEQEMEELRQNRPRGRPDSGGRDY